jgi:tRNA threonylcarbamoyl adenosine modification protein YeaZ
VRLLAVETTATTGSLAVAEIQHSEIKFLATRRWRKKSSHSEVITLECAAALKEAGLSLDSLTHLACDIGPGSFTGIRVGLNLTRALAFALNLRVRLFQSLEIFAYEHLSVGQSGVVAIPAVQEYLYGGAYRRADHGVETLRPVESLDHDGLEQLKTQTKVDLVIFPQEEPKVESLVTLVGMDPRESAFLDWERIKPLYIRRSEAEEKLRKGLLKPVL